MKNIIIVQGMACLGKSTLAKQLEKDIPNCKRFSLDEYKEDVWDKFGFNSVKERERQSEFARQMFYSDVNDAVKDPQYDCILLDYAFTLKYWDELIENLKNWHALTKTIYMLPENLSEHQKAWEDRSRDFSVRHAGHGATQYHDGVGKGYENEYGSKVFADLPTVGDTINVKVSFNPYSMSVPYDYIVDFVNGNVHEQSLVSEDEHEI